VLPGRSMKKAKYSADFQNLDSIRDFVGEAAEQAGFSGKEVYAVQLAADEACSNVIEHAYAGIPDGVIDVSCDVANDQLTITIHDRGKEFDISSVRKPNLSRNLSEREVGGLGVFLIYKLMDEVHFESSGESGNTLTMVKRKSGAP
jgi:serine/threonine-protein kinase RsbW